jgi:hypothetical protein
VGGRSNLKPTRNELKEVAAKFGVSVAEAERSLAVYNDPDAGGTPLARELVEFSAEQKAPLTAETPASQEAGVSLIQQSEQRTDKVRGMVSDYRSGNTDKQTFLTQLADQVAAGELTQDHLTAIMGGLRETPARIDYDDIGWVLREGHKADRLPSTSTGTAPNVASPQENETPVERPPVPVSGEAGSNDEGVAGDAGEVAPVKKAPTKKTTQPTEPDFSPADKEEQQKAKRTEFLADQKFRDAMEGYARTAGWDQVGGLPITNDGSIPGRLPWIPKDPWFQKSVSARKGLAADAIPRLIRQFGRGEAPTTKPATNLLDFLIDDYIEGQALNEEAAWLADQLTADEQVLLDQLTSELEKHPAFGRDRLEMLLETLSNKYPDITPAQFNRALIKTYEITLNGLKSPASQPGTTSATGQAPEGSTGTVDQGAGGEAGGEPLLSSYNQAELDAETARVKAEIDRQKQADAAAEAKKKADQDRDSFTLAGSNNAADIAAANGQVDLVDEVKKQEADQPQEKSNSRSAIRDQIAQHFASGQGFKNINEARAFVQNLTGVKAESGTVAIKLVDELLEQAVVQRARQIVKDAKTPQEAYQQLVQLYELQPSFNVRTSTSMEQQAYSTPVPLAFLASQLAGVSLDSNAVVVEPTAGNGALLIEADTEQVLANELNPQRADWLRDQGYETSTQDATQWNPTAANPGQWVDIIIANPPFGTVKSDGKVRTWEVPSGVAPTGKFETGEIDHAIVLKQLSYLKDDGVAVLIVGGVDAQNDESKANKYNGKAKREFYYTLFNDYNVEQMFTVSGSLYGKQGASYPVDVIVIRGRGKSALTVPAASLPKVYDSWSALEGLLPNDKETVTANGVPGSTGESTPERDRPDTGKAGTGTEGNAPANPESVGDRANTPEKDVPGERDRGSNERPGASPSTEQAGAAAATDQAGIRPVAADVAGGMAASEAVVVKQPNNYGKTNTVFTEDAAAKARELLRSKLNRPNMGLDPEMVQAGITLAGYHIEAGARSFVEYAKAMVADLGDMARPYLRSWYEAVRYYPGFDAQGMTPAAETDQIEKNLDQYLNPPTQEATPDETPPVVKTNESEDQNAEVASENQAQYEPASEKSAIGTLVPVNMQTAVKSALAALEDRVGPIDAYVAVELGYSDAELGQYFAAEQIDAIALAIDNIGNSKGFVIGDQTGIGKGRVNAAVMRWAIKQGKTPIFVTEKPNLYRDMIRDLKDIGMGTGATEEQQMQSILDMIQMTNSGENIPMDDAALEWYEKTEEAKRNKDNPPKPYGYFLKAPSSAKQGTILAGIEQSGKLPDTKKIVFTTYAQMQPVRGNPTVRTHMLNAIISNSILLLDESHNAGGTPQAQANASFNRAEFVRSLVERASGVFYSSATFAKRPDVMDLYSRTDMRLAVSNIGQLGATIEAGGVPLQQVVSSMLVESGQYLRRERSFEGVEYSTTEAPMDQQVAENIATSMRNILDFSTEASHAVGVISAQLTAQAQSMGGTQATGPVGADSTGFGSVMHNLIAQFLLGLKAQSAVDKALEAIKNGEKPVITVANTMESLINEYADLNGINIGDPIDLTFGNLLERYLEKSRMVREKKPFQPQRDPARRLTDEELGPRGVRLFNQALREIRAQDWSKIPASPLDFIKGELIKAGYKVGEITGRQGTIDYTGATPTYRMRGDNERGIPGRIRSIQQFNNGETDVLLLNRAGSTGLSLHASPKAGSDLRRRHMIIAQAEANIDTHMQMLGRVHRTGQVVAPRYSQLVGDIPAEIRPAAVLAKKMASLNANTTSARESAVTSKDALDIMNLYGDEAIAAVMFANQDLHARMGDPLSLNSAGDGFETTDAARKVTGRIPILPLHQQAQIYTDFENEYRSILETAIALGENKLEAMTLETDAKEVSSNKVFNGVPGERSPFAASANAVTYDIKRQGRSMTQEEITKELADFVGVENLTPALLRQKNDDIRDTLQQEVRDFIDREAVRLSETELNSLERRTDAMLDNINNTLSSIPPGSSVSILTPNGSVFYGIVIGLDRKGTPKNPAANSAWKIKVAVADSMRTLSLPLTRFELGDNTDNGRVAIELYDPMMVQEAFDNQSGLSRENRVIMEGNLLAAYSQFRLGQIVYFRHHNGELRQGIMMSRGFDLAAAIRERASILNTSEEAHQFLSGNNPTLYLSGQHGEVIIQYRPQRGMFSFRVPASRANGGRWFLNDDIRAITGDFVKTGNQMVTWVSPQQLQDVLRTVYQSVGETLRGVDGNTAPAPTDPTAQPASSRPQFSIAAELDAPVLSSAYVLGASKPNLTPLQVLDMADAGEAVSADEFAILQAYLSGVFAQTPALGVDSLSFKTWFGRSKIVSKKTGQPIKMYHATGADFTVFDLERAGKGTSHPTAAMGFFFSNDKGHAATKYGDNVMEVYLAIERPYLMTDADLRQIDGIEEAKAFREKLIAQGYDGIAMPAETSTRYVAAFYPDQIKLTNNETYTRGVDDIRYSRGSNQAPGLTQSGFVSALKRAFPYLSEALDKVLARGLRGEKGGTVLINSNDPNEIARVYAEKTGRSFADALKEIQASLKKTDRDAEYLDAVNRGDMVAAQQMVDDAARAAGYGFERGERDYDADYIEDGDGESGFGVYAYPTGQPLFRKYYTANGETRIWIKPIGEVVDLTKNTERAGVLDHARRQGITANAKNYYKQPFAVTAYMMSQHPNASGYIVPHVGQGVPSGKQVVFKSSSILHASSDPVTYDDAGNVIPLSQRFVRTKENVSFSKSSGKMQGFYDPRSGLIFAILPNLSTQSAPAVFLHETGHGQQRDDITKRAVDIINQRNAANGQYRAFLDRVNTRLAAAGLIDKDGVLTDENEAATYIIEQAVLEGKQNGFNYVDGRFMDWVDAKIGKPVGDLIRKLVNFIRAAMLRRGFPLNINKLTVDDLVSFAQIGVEKAARGGVRVVETETAATRSYAGPNAKTADQSLLQQAKARVESGEDVEVVRKETGWFKGLEGRWKFEVDDSNVSLSPNYDDFRGIPTRLEDVLIAPELFAAYPELTGGSANKGVLVFIDVHSSYKEGKGSFAIQYGDKVITIEAPNQREAVSVLLHEVQHAVQRIEGFATGGSPRETKYDDVPPDIRKLGDALTTKLTYEF